MIKLVKKVMSNTVKNKEKKQFDANNIFEPDCRGRGSNKQGFKMKINSNSYSPGSIGNRKDRYLDYVMEKGDEFDYKDFPASKHKFVDSEEKI